MAKKQCTGCGERNEAAGYEIAIAFAERTTKRLWVVIIILIGLLLATNAGWLWYESQFEYIVEETVVEQEVEQNADNGGNNNFVGGDYIGEAEG
jgi:hypothetical protein